MVQYVLILVIFLASEYLLALFSYNDSNSMIFIDVIFRHGLIWKTYCCHCLVCLVYYPIIEQCFKVMPRIDELDCFGQEIHYSFSKHSNKKPNHIT